MSPERRSDRPDGTPCDEWRIIDSRDVFSLEDRREIIATFTDNISMNPNVDNPVGHISLNFHELDKDKINDKRMVEIAGKYMERMGIKDTPYILVRHLDKPYPHCHLVYSRIDNFGKTISDSHDYDRNRRACSTSQKNMGFIFLMGKRTQKSESWWRRKYDMRFSMLSMMHGKIKTSIILINSRLGLKPMELRLNTNTSVVQVKFKDSGTSVKGNASGFEDKIEDSVTAVSGSIFLRYRTYGIRSQSGCNADGTIVSISSLYGVKFTTKQIQDYTAGKTIRVDGCQGEYSTVYLKFIPEIRNRPRNVLHQIPTHLNLLRHLPSPPSFNRHNQPLPPASDECSVSGSDTETFEQFKAQHPELTPEQALDAWRAKRRGKHLNGGFHMGM